MLETKLNKNETILKNLLKFQGIGKTRANIICKVLGINGNKRLHEISKNNREKLIILLAKIKKQTFENIQIVSSDLEVTLFSKELIKNEGGTYMRDPIRVLIKKDKAIEREYSTTKDFQLGGQGVMRILNKTNNKMNSSITRNPSNIYLIEENLLDYKKKCIYDLIATNSYRGRCIKNGYPARGQRTRSNARTARKLNKQLKF